MCGIAGWFSSKPSRDLVDKVGQMVGSQHHRGPDDYGVVEVASSPHVVLGQARLAIIDTSPDGHQPMSDPETGNLIVFNGEIYNFKDLRRELEAAGSRFRTHSDTEVILKAYAAWGDGCCVRLRGIFAFALWDKSKREVFVARDQLGVKPFYYCRPQGGFAFASEVRPLLKGGAVEPVVDAAGLSSYFAYGSVQEPFTLIKGVRSLPPGHCGTVSSAGVGFKRYWSPVDVLDHEERAKRFETKDAAYEQVAHTLKEAVSLQMISDVPLGAFLSGGIDSSAVVSLMRQTHSGAVKTFSIVFDVPEFDERRYAAAVAGRNGTEHVELELTGALAKAHLDQALAAFDQPSMDGLNTWFVSKLVKDAGLTVALSGVGGDELFVGYGGFEKPLSMARWQKRIGWLPAALGGVIASAAQSEKIRKFGQMMGYPLPAYFLGRQVFSPAQRASLLRADCLCGLDSWANEAFGNVLTDGFGRDDVDKVSICEMGTYMLSTLLRDTDQMSMAHSLEVRVPLIDSVLVEQMLRVPSLWKRDASTPKPMLVHAAGAGLPTECIYRPKKGFSLPFETWFKGEMHAAVADFCNGSSCFIFDDAGLRKLWREYEAGVVKWSRIWGLFVLDRWLHKHRLTA